MKMLWTIVILLILILIIGYSIKTQQQTKFSKDKWCYKDVIEYPYRESMLNDLLANHKLIGLKYSELINLIGLPESNYSHEGYEIYYEIETDFGWDIDPVSSKTLGFEMTKDSIICNFKLYVYDK